MKLIPRNWREFQHYSGRSSPWVKLYHRLLDDKEFHALSDASRALAPMLWLLASESQTGEIDGSEENLCFRLRKSWDWISPALKPLIDRQFFSIASGSLAACKQTASPMLPQENKKEENRKEENRTPTPSGFALPDWVPKEPWDGYIEMRVKMRKPMTDRAKGSLVKKIDALRAKGYSPAALLDEAAEKNWLSIYEPKSGGAFAPASGFEGVL